MIIINADLEKSYVMWHLPWQRILQKLNSNYIHKYEISSWLTLCIEPTFQIVGTMIIRGQTRRNTAVSICDHRIVILYVYAKLNQQIFHAYEIARCKTNISLILPSQKINLRLYKCQQISRLSLVLFWYGISRFTSKAKLIPIGIFIYFNQGK